MRARTRGTIVLAIAFTLYWLLALRLDATTTLVEQETLALSAWAFLALALRFSPRDERVQVLTMVAVATACECIGSLIWGAYTYRLANLPLYVPAGHGLFYLTALRVAQLPSLVRRRRVIVVAVVGAGAALLVRNLAFAPLPDVLGLVTFGVFLRFIVRGRYPLLYAVSFAMTMALEFYGTSLRIWTWSPVLPGLSLPAANPPAGIGAGYCAMDGLARRLAPRLASILVRLRIPVDGPPAPVPLAE